MTDDQQPLTPFEAWKTWTRTDPAWEEAKRRLWAMTRDERVQAMRAGRCRCGCACTGPIAHRMRSRCSRTSGSSSPS